jgi:hypothetical protein
MGGTCCTNCPPVGVSQIRTLVGTFFLAAHPIVNNSESGARKPFALVMPRLTVSCKEDTRACPNTALFMPQFVAPSTNMWGIALQKSCRRCSGRMIDEIVAMYAVHQEFHKNK